jgi:hypothetical protein
MLLVQAAWIITMPTYRGIDEFDHVYKAAAVARGEFRSTRPAPSGRGSLVTIPASIVAAASSVCRSYDYTGHDNCFPVRRYDDGTVDAATGAAAYNPAYYVVVGPLARPFGGDAADFVMRAETALLCALLLAWGAALLARWSRSPWPLTAYVVGLTPVFTYSTSIATPNGLTYAGAALVWAAAIEVMIARPVRPALASPLAVGSVVVLATHSTGPMWLLLIAVACAFLGSFRPLWDSVKSKPVPWLTATTVVAVSTALCVTWVRVADTISTTGLTADDIPRMSPGLLTEFNALWLFQQIAAFPTRSEPGPVISYVIWSLVLLWMVVLLLRVGTGRLRLTGVVLLGLLIAVPTAITLRTYGQIGLSWQGRYTLPVAFGLPLVTALVMERAGRPLPRVAQQLLFGALAVAIAWSTVFVGLREVHHGPSDPAAADLPLGFVLVAILAAAGTLLMGRAAAGTSVRNRSPEPVDVVS